MTLLCPMTLTRDPRLYSRTKIVATVGPACSSREQLAKLIAAGVDVFRLNMAHAEPDVQQQHVELIRSLSEEFNEPIAILVDLAGPKIRLGNVAGDRPVGRLIAGTFCFVVVAAAATVAGWPFACCETRGRCS